MHFHKWTAAILIGLALSSCNHSSPKPAAGKTDSTANAPASAASTSGPLSANDARIQAMFAYADSIPAFKNYRGKDVTGTDPGIFFAFAYHCYHTNRKDEAVFWFYWAQVRAKFMAATIVNQGLDNCDKDYLTKVATEMGGTELPEFVNHSRMSLYGIVSGNFKPEIEDYSFAAIDNHVRISQSVIDHERQFPLDPARLLPVSNLASVEKRNASHQKILQDFEQLISWADRNKETIRERRKANKLPNR